MQHDPSYAVYSFCFVGLVTGFGFIILHGLWRIAQHLQSRANYRRLIRQQRNTIVMPTRETL